MTCCNYISLYLFFLFSLCSFYEIESFIPVGRHAHSSVFTGNKLYFFGGRLSSNEYSDDVFYLDLSQSFDMAAPPWNDLTPIVRIPFRSGWATASFSNISNEPTIYLFNGLTPGDDVNEFIKVPDIYSFEINSFTWSTPIIKGSPPKRRMRMQSVIDNTGKMYIFGGMANAEVGSTIKFFNETIIFNTVELSWSINNSPVDRRASYTATLLSNGIIVYIGGFNGTKLIDISQIDIYDTYSLTWSNKVCIILL